MSLYRTNWAQRSTAMSSKGLLAATLSTDTKHDAGDNARKPLKPLLGMLCYGQVFILLV